MGFQFPNSPSVNQVYTAPTGLAYTWDGLVWKMTGTSGVVTADSYNRIVNGAMQHSQENGNTGSANASVLSFYAADQWTVLSSTSPGTGVAQRIQTVTPNGSINRFLFQVGTAKASLAAGDYLLIRQSIEGSKVADFGYGSASAKQSVLRFGWRSPAGTYSIKLGNSAGNRSYIANFTITAGQANADTVQTFVIPGDTTGTWLTDSGIGIVIDFAIAAGTTSQGVAGWQAGSVLVTSANTNGMATAAAIYNLYDVGLYLDPNNTGVPPPWVTPDYASELIACKRYWQTALNAIFSGNVTSGSTYYAQMILPVTMRATPTANGTNGSASGFPATVGTTNVFLTWLREGRVASATGFGQFNSSWDLNARM
jgi:hypothetical protein